MSSTSSFPTTTSSPSPSSTPSKGGSSPGSFYRNLFYILIGLLCAFGLVSFLSLLRARKRRYAIINEANRLGVLVPGIPGYVPLRERRHMGWMKADGSQQPDWWEVEKRAEDVTQANGREGLSGGERWGKGSEDMHPLAIVPPRPDVPDIPPIPISELKFFPNHLAYRPESLVPPKSVFVSSDPAVLDGLVGGKIGLVAVVRMPQPDTDHSGRAEEGEEVIAEWGGVELGIAQLEVVQSGSSSNTNTNGTGTGPGWRY